MTTLQVTLTDEIAKAAQSAGLLSSEAIEALITHAVKAQQVDAFFSALDRLQTDDPRATDTPSEADIAQAIATVRARSRKSTH
jgi:peptidoglycan hydrolase-like amidase